MTPTSDRLRLLGVTCLLLLLSGCLIFRGVRVEPESPEAQPRVIRTPLKAHLADGSIVLFRDGARIEAGAVLGRGVRHGLLLTDSASIDFVPLDSVLAMESFRTEVNTAATFASFTLATAGTLLLGALAYEAIFGSCPTVYSDSAGTPVLEAEAFSYSIAPLFEMRDVDRLRAMPDSSGKVRLEVRNEALETHYLNHVELIEVVHARGERIVTDPGGAALAIRATLPPVRALDRAYRDVLAELARDDDLAFASDKGVLARADADEPDDFVELEFPALEADSVVLHLRARNSLLTTVLFYDVMLADQGARALDWLGGDLDQIGPAMELGLWAVEHLGLRVLVWDGSDWRQVARIPDPGPIAWKEIGVVVPVPSAGPIRLRLAFLADSWRIDRASLSPLWRRPEGRLIPLSGVIGPAGDSDARAHASLLRPDDRYLRTLPGHRFEAVFQAGASPPDGERTLLLASQGYYVEWVRRAWLEESRAERPFAADRAVLGEALRRWRADQEDLERRFFTTQVPVR